MKKISSWYVVFDTFFAIMSFSAMFLCARDVIPALTKETRTFVDGLYLLVFCGEIVMAIGFTVRAFVLSAYKVIYSAQDESEAMK